MPLSADLVSKSVLAAVAAIEIYNKPNFSYREEAFALLMTNAWELLLKAKWLIDHGERVESLQELVDDGAGGKKTKLNRSGNPVSHGAGYLAAKLREDRNSGFEAAAHENILALIEIRDNAAHFVNKDLYLGRRVLEIGTASLRNYLCLATEWFQTDLSTYNFFLMPLSFYHGFEAAEPATRAHYPEQVQRLLAYLDSIEGVPQEEGAKQHVALRLETKLVRGKDAASVAFRWTDDPAAPALTVREEDVFKNYPMTYRDLADTMKRRYSNFLENREFHKLRQSLEKDTKFAIVRLLHPANPKSSKQRFYNANILQEFDRRYLRRRRGAE
ncbi:hypothetical protein BWI17_21510 [Betaproteobacteria bacterium GR16-43]|nr:hypothetical protein BWI17_21510 [Betaproteobacteria bacterium GR16-43]